MHPAHFGDLFIITAAGFAIASMIVYFLTWRGKEALLSLARRLYLFSTLFTVMAIGLLLYLILAHDFRVAYVYSYSSTDLPLGFLISSLWGGQEGTFLLWAVYTVLLGIIMMRTSGSFEKGNMFFLNLFLLSLLLIMIKKSPFELMPVFRIEGAGLNPLLQNYWMQIHPPIMFVGFAAVTFPFLFAITAMVERKYQIWAEAARRWTVFAWVALGVSLVLGGYWAYETLGWGGFWAWDPVENSSLIPWIFLTTQVHALLISRQRRGMMRFSIFAVCLSFWSVLYGTFLTRSGVLADFSVHSFVNLGINSFLIGGMLMFIGIGLFLFILRWSDIRPEPSYSQVASRSYFVTLGIVVLFLGGVLVLIGTSAPLLSRFMENPSAVSPQYYYATMTPIGIALLILITLFPVFRWNKGMAKPRLLIIAGIAAACTGAVIRLTGITSEILYLMIFMMASSAILVNVYVFVESVRLNRHQPGYLAHIGLAVALIGATSSAGLETRETVILPQGEEVTVMGDIFRFANLQETAKGYDCLVEVNDGTGTFIATLVHEFPKNAEGVMRKPHVENYLAYDLYLAPLALERSEKNDPGTLRLDKGGSETVGKYTITFHDFEMGDHVQATNMVRAVALVTVSYDGISESIEPTLELVDDQVTPVPASFDSESGLMYIAGVRPEDGGVILKLSGDFLPPPDPGTASLVVEISRKPLIILFWFGCGLVFFSGALSTIKYRRRKKLARTEQIVPGQDQKLTAAS